MKDLIFVGYYLYAIIVVGIFCYAVFVLRCSGFWFILMLLLLDKTPIVNTTENKKEVKE